MKFNRTVAGLTAASMLAMGTAVPTYADPAPAVESQAQAPAFAGYNPPAVVNQPTTLVAKVTAGTEGEVRFTLDDGTPLTTAPISPDGTASAQYTFNKAGQRKIKAAVMTDGVVGEYTEPYTVTVVRPGSSARIDVNGELNTDAVLAASLGLAASLVVLIGGFSRIPAVNATITQVQKQLGIYNEGIALQVERGLPVAGTLVGGAGLIASIVPLVQALKQAEVTVTSSRVDVQPAPADPATP